MIRFHSTATGALTAALVASTIFAAPALATPGSGFVPSPIVSGNFGTLSINTSKDKTDKWGLILKTLDSTDISSDRLTVQAGGYSGWHAHPGPVFVTVTQGSIVWYNGSDPLCTGKPYSAGQSFIEDAYVTHNATSETGAEFIAIAIKPVGFPGPAFRLNRDKPNNCNF